LEYLGFSLARRESHDTYTKPGHPRTVTVPRNRRAVTPGTLSSIFRQMGITKTDAQKIRENLRR
jgi:predicted RNA binding protein YcfA (HicA-like mRNA interferase family)